MLLPELRGVNPLNADNAHAKLSPKFSNSKPHSSRDQQTDSMSMLTHIFIENICTNFPPGLQGIINNNEM